MRNAQKKILRRIETIVTSFNGPKASLELIVNHSLDNSGPHLRATHRQLL